MSSKEPPVLSTVVPTQQGVLATPDIPTLEEYMALSNQYHFDTVGQKKARRNEDGGLTTVYSTGVEVDGMIYELPGYDRDTGKKLTEDQVRAKYLPLIQSGQLPGLPKDSPLVREYPHRNHKEVIDKHPFDRKAVIGYDFKQQNTQ
jgi:hypothetical protein